MTSIHKRVVHLIDDQTDGNRSKFADATGLSNSVVQALCNRPDSGMSSSTAAAILNTYPDLNARWLICGTGEPWHTPVDVHAQLSELREEVNVFKDMYVKLQGEVSEVRELNKQLKQSLEHENMI